MAVSDHRRDGMLVRLRREPQSRDTARVWRVESLPGLELLRASFATHAFTPHAHDVFMIGVCEDGAGEVTVGGERVVAGPGSVLLLNPGDVYSARPQAGAPWRYRAFYPDEALLRRITLDLTGSESSRSFRPGVTDDAELVPVLRRLHASLESPGLALERQTHLLNGLGRLVMRHTRSPDGRPPGGSEHRAVRRARDYLEAHATEDVTLETLAREAGVGPYHLVRVFHRDMGLPPHVYQSQLRVRLAKSLLAAGMPPGRVAQEAGFYDQSHFTRWFKRHLGVSPGQYATGVAGGSGARQLRPR
jgi:AraC-like DNA-binding protein